MKRLLIALMLFVCHLAMFAAVEVDGFCYQLNDETGTAEVTSGGSYSGNITIPAKIDYNSCEYSVTSIGFRAFYECGSLTSVEIPNSVTSIGESVFDGCSSLTSIKLPNSITSIGDWAFDDCSSLTSIEIPNSVTSIGYFAFSYCESLTSVEIPNSMTSIGSGAFAACSNLTSITVATGNKNFSSEDGVLFNYDKTTLICYPGGKEGHYVIPNSVTSIGDYAFYGCRSLTSIELPNSVTSIGDHAFYYCSNLTSVELPNSVTSIGSQAFNSCYSLTDVINLAEQPQNIDYYTFSTYGTLHVLPGCKAAYEAAEYWNEFTIVEDADQYADEVISGGLNFIYAVPQQLWGGEETYITLSMNNSIEVVGLSFNMQLPEGFEFVFDDQGEAIVEWYGGREDEHTLSSRLQDDGMLTVTALSISGYSIQGTEGELMRVKVRVPDDMDATVPITLHDIELGDLDAQCIRVPQTETMYEVKAYLLGDVNTDREVTISDATGVVGMILGSAPASLNRKAADVNKDGSVSISDASGIVGIILNKSSLIQAPQRNADLPLFGIEATVEEASATSLLLPITLTDAAYATAMQLDVTLPAGMELTAATADEDHVAQFARQADGSYRVVCLSLANDAFIDAQVLTLTLSTASAAAGTIAIEGIEVTGLDLDANHLPALYLTTGTNALETIAADRRAAKVLDLLGQPRQSSYKGIRIEDGKKVIR